MQIRFNPEISSTQVHRKGVGRRASPGRALQGASTAGSAGGVDCGLCRGHRGRALHGASRKGVGRRASLGRRTGLQREGWAAVGEEGEEGRGRGGGRRALTEDGGELLRGGDGQPAGVVSFSAQMSLAVSAIWGKWGWKKAQLYILGSLVPVHRINRDQWINGPGWCHEPGPMTWVGALLSRHVPGIDGPGLWH
jgi:hypothetical protein